MLVMGGVLSIICGIAAVSSSHFFVAGASYIVSGLNTWGWIVMAFGALEALAALSIWRGGEFALFGMSRRACGVAAMMSIPAYPFWALALVAIDVLVIYGLAAYGGKPYLTRVAPPQHVGRSLRRPPDHAYQTSLVLHSCHRRSRRSSTGGDRRGRYVPPPSGFLHRDTT